MSDILGYRHTFGVITPSTNTVVQPEYDDMRPVGVTNHIGRMHIPDEPVKDDDGFNELIRRIDVAMEEAIDRVMTCRPDHLILGISAESIWGGGRDAADRIEERVSARTGGLPFTQAADALPAALEALGVRERVSFVTPYYPVAESHILTFAAQSGYTPVRMKHLSRPGPVEIGHTPLTLLRAAVHEVNGDDVEAIVQFGANLPMGRLAARLETELAKPVICVNTATYWHALRSAGIPDRQRGFGRLMAEH